MVLIGPIAKVGKGHRNLIEATLGASFPDGYEAIRVLVWERSKQNRVDHTEHCSVCADAESQCDYGYGDKARSLNQAANTVTDVIDEGFHNWLSGLGSLVFGLWSLKFVLCNL